MAIKKDGDIEIGGRLFNTATGNVIAGADAIKDEAKNRYQDDINNDVVRHENKIYGTGGIDQRLDAIEAAESITYEGGSAQIAQASDFDSSEPADRAKIPTVGAIQDGLDDGVLDVSEKYPTSGYQGGNTYTLEGALAVLDANLSANKRKGGMSIKFIQLTPATYSVVKTKGLTEQPTGTELQEALAVDTGSYTAEQLSGITLPSAVGNSVTYWLAVTADEVTTYTTWIITYASAESREYVQHRYMGTSIATADFTNPANWQGVDKELVTGSRNLAESGDVVEFVHKSLYNQQIYSQCDFEMTGYSAGYQSLGGTLKAGVEYKIAIRLTGFDNKIPNVYTLYRGGTSSAYKVSITDLVLNSLTNEREAVITITPNVDVSYIFMRMINSSTIPPEGNHVYVDTYAFDDKFLRVDEQSLTPAQQAKVKENIGLVIKDVFDEESDSLSTDAAIADYVKDVASDAAGELDKETAVLSRNDMNLQETLILSGKPDGVNYFLDTYSYYEPCVEEIYIPDSSKIEFKYHGVSLYCRAKDSAGEYRWKSTTDLNNYKPVNGEIFELKVTEAGSDENYSVGDTIGYVIFKDVDTFKENPLSNHTTTLVDGVATNIDYCFKIAKSLGYYDEVPVIMDNTLHIPYQIKNQTIDELNQKATDAAIKAGELNTETAVLTRNNTKLQETMLLGKPDSVKYFLDNYSYYEQCIDELYIIPNVPNIVFKYYSNRLFVRALDGSSTGYKWHSATYVNTIENGKIVELKVTIAGTDENYPLDSTIGYVIFKDIESFINNPYGPYIATLVDGVANEITYSPKIAMSFGYYNSTPIITGDTIYIPYKLKNPTTDGLKQEIDDIKPSQSLNILFLGNSYTANAVSYVPFILKNVCPTLKFRIGVLFLNGGKLSEHLANILNEDVVNEDGETISPQNYNKYSYITDEMNHWGHDSTNITIFKGLDDATWDIVSTHNANRYVVGEWSECYAPFIYRLHKAIAEYLKYPIKFGWDLTHGSNMSSVEADVTKFMASVDKAEKAEQLTCTEIIFPYGTAVQNLRTIPAMQALGDGSHGNLLIDNSHLQSGIGQLAASYAVAIKLLEQVGCTSKIIAESTFPTTEWVRAISTIRGADIGTGSIGVTEHNCFLAQVAAIQAVKKPYEITDINEYDINED